MKGRFSKSGMGGASFFAFQDIITGTAGFLIVIAVFLALGLDQVVGVSEDTDPALISEDDLNPLLAEITRLKTEIGQLQVLPAQDEVSLRRMVDDLKASVSLLAEETHRSAMITPRLNDSSLDREAQIEKEKHLTQLAILQQAQEAANQQLQQSAQTLITMEQRTKDAEAQMQRSRDRQNVLRLIPERSDTSKEPILVLVRGNTFVVQSFDGAKAQIARSETALMESLAVLSPTEHYVVLYFKPSGAHHFARLTQKVRRAGFEIGYDLIPEILELETSSAPITQ
jgi:hypothetical protein